MERKVKEPERKGDKCKEGKEGEEREGKKK